MVSEVHETACGATTHRGSHNAKILTYSLLTLCLRIKGEMMDHH
jgi:hypothetical protein